MTVFAHVFRKTLMKQIEQFECKIEEHRLVEIPDLEAIGNLKANLETLRKQLSELDAMEAPEVPYAPI